MGKYVDRKKEVKVDKDHTNSLAWKGIGCLLMIIIPIISFAAASLTIVNDTMSQYLPSELYGYPVMPQFLQRTTYEIQMLFSPIFNTENFYALAVVTVIYIIVLGMAISLLYAIIFRVVNPRQYSPLDAPPPNVKAKKYKR